MDNDEILNWRKWSVVRKAQVLVAAFGCFGTIGELLIAALFAQSRHTPLLGWWDLLEMLIILPTDVILYFCGASSWLSRLDTAAEISLFYLSLVVLVNTILFFAIGTLVGLWLKEKQSA